MSVRKKSIKIFVVAVVSTLMFTLSSCKKISVHHYDNAATFIELIEDYQTGDKENGAVIDLRDFKKYENGHIKMAHSFDYAYNDQATFIEWMLTNFDNNTIVFLIDDGNNEYETVLSWLEDSIFKKVHIYTKGYDILKSDPNFELKIYEATGIDPCGC